MTQRFNPTQLKAGLNRIYLVGQVHEPPELRYRTDGTRWVRFRLETAEYGHKNGQLYRHVQYHSIAVFGTTMPDIVHGTVHVRDFVMVEGRLVYGRWKDRDGRSVTSTTIFAGTVLLLTPSHGGLTYARNLTPCPDLIDSAAPIEIWESKDAHDPQGSQASTADAAQDPPC